MKTTKQTKNEIRTENAEMLYGAFLMSTEGLSDTERKACAEVLILILMECLLRLYKSVNYKSILISVFITY